MKRRIVNMTLVALLAASMITGCGKEKEFSGADGENKENKKSSIKYVHNSLFY